MTRSQRALGSNPSWTQPFFQYPFNARVIQCYLSFLVEKYKFAIPWPRNNQAVFNTANTGFLISNINHTSSAKTTPKHRGYRLLIIRQRYSVQKYQFPKIRADCPPLLYWLKVAPLQQIIISKSLYISWITQSWPKWSRNSKAQISPNLWSKFVIQTRMLKLSIMKLSPSEIIQYLHF